MYLFLAVQGLCGCTRAFSSCGDGSHLLLQGMGSRELSSCGWRT